MVDRLPQLTLSHSIFGVATETPSLPVQSRGRFCIISATQGPVFGLMVERDSAEIAAKSKSVGVSIFRHYQPATLGALPRGRPSELYVKREGAAHISENVVAAPLLSEAGA